MQKTNTQRAFLTESKDVFVKEETTQKLSEKEAVKEFAKQNREKWGNRFSDFDKRNFAELYSKDKIDFDIVDCFAKTTLLPVESISKIYVMEKEPENKNFRETVLNAVKNLDKGLYALDFKKSIYEPNGEFALRVSDMKKSITEEYLNQTYLYFDKKSGEKLGKESFKGNRRSSDHVEVKYEDYRAGAIKESYQLTTYEREKIPVVEKEVIKMTDPISGKDKKVVMSKSTLPGVYNITEEYADGKKVDVVKAEIRNNVRSVKKDMRSSDGTRTEYLYEDDPQGNRIIDYKITDENGKVLMKNSSTFEVVSDNKFISSKNGHKYEITTNENSIHVKDINHSGKETSIEFDKKIKGDKEEIIKLLKKVPGEELFETVDTINKIDGQNEKQLLNSAYNKLTKEVYMADNLFVFLHELGHAKDGEYNNGLKDLLTHSKNVYEKDNNIQKIYLEERKKFNDTYPNPQRSHLQYFIQADGHYGGKWGGLQEVIAEQNAIINAIPDKPIEGLGSRSQYLQQHFPKTIAEIQKAMNYKNDLEAIQFYGT